MAALLVAGLAVPGIEASLLPKTNIKTILVGLERDYRQLVQQVPRLESVTQASPTFRALLYLEQNIDRFIPETWASLQPETPVRNLHRYLLVQDDFLQFLGSTDATGHPLVPAADAVRVYSAALVASRVFHIPPSLLLCLLLQESRLRATAVSATGAEGVGQLTGIGIEQVDELLDRSSRWRSRLAAFETTLARLYADETTREVFAQLVPEMRLPVFKKINHVERSGVSENLLRRVRAILSHKHAALASDVELLRTLCTELRAGRRVAESHAPVARAFRIAQTELYNVQTGNTFNPETNVVVSSILFRHYMRYPWSLDGRRLSLPFALRCALAVIAYNQGPKAAREILRHASEAGQLTLDESDLVGLLALYTEQFVAESVSDQPNFRPTELYRHFASVMSCALAADPDSALPGWPKPKGAKLVLASRGPAKN